MFHYQASDWVSTGRDAKQTKTTSTHGSAGIDIIDNTVRRIVVVPKVPVIKEGRARPSLLEVPERVVLLSTSAGGRGLGGAAGRAPSGRRRAARSNVFVSDLGLAVGLGGRRRLAPGGRRSRRRGPRRRRSGRGRSGSVEPYLGDTLVLSLLDPPLGLLTRAPRSSSEDVVGAPSDLFEIGDERPRSFCHGRGGLLVRSDVGVSSGETITTGKVSRDAGREERGGGEEGESGGRVNHLCKSERKVIKVIWLGLIRMGQRRRCRVKRISILRRREGPSRTRGGSGCGQKLNCLFA